MCANVPLSERIEASDIAFVGRLVSSRPDAHGRLYRFAVDQLVKGPVGQEIDVEAPELTDSQGTPLVRDTAVGVLARLDGARIETDSCGLADPGGLLASFDEPRGNAVKVLIGLVILAAVLTFSLVRLRRRSRAVSGATRPPV